MIQNITAAKLFVISLSVNEHGHIHVHIKSYMSGGSCFHDLHSIVYCGIFAQSKNCGVTTAGHYLAMAHKQQQRNGVF